MKGAAVLTPVLVALLAEVRTPDGFYPLEIGEDYLLGIAKDEYGVETVLLYGLDRS